MDKKAMYKLSYGLFVLTTKDYGKDNGCIINTAIQAASSPNQICISVNKANFTHDMIHNAKEFNISVISEDATFDLFKHFGFQSGRVTSKFDSFNDYKMADNAIFYITKGCNAYLSVKVDMEIDLGSHTMFIGTVTDAQVLSDVKSMTYEYYMENVKPKPTDVKVGVTEDGKTIWRCTVCGYEYIGEELPEDYICPLCKHPASDFEKITK